jgi:hypothetical protein
VPFFGHAFLSPIQTNDLILTNKATVALTRLEVVNYFGQTNGAAVAVRVVERSCGGGSVSRQVATYDVQAGRTESAVFGSPLVLKPLAANDPWCLTAEVAVQGNPSVIFLPEASISGYVVSGTLPPDAVTTMSADVGSGPKTERVGAGS